MLSKRVLANMGWIGSVNGPTTLSLQELNRGVNDRTFWKSLVHRVSIKWSPLDST